MLESSARSNWRPFFLFLPSGVDQNMSLSGPLDLALTNRNAALMVAKRASDIPTSVIVGREKERVFLNEPDTRH